MKEKIVSAVFEPLPAGDLSDAHDRFDLRLAVIVLFPARAEQRHRDEPLARQGVGGHGLVSLLKNMERQNRPREEDHVGQRKQRDRHLTVERGIQWGLHTPDYSAEVPHHHPWATLESPSANAPTRTAGNAPR